MGLVTRLYECTGGKVSIDGEDVRDLNIGHLRNIIGIVQQEPVLFHGSVVSYKHLLAFCKIHIFSLRTFDLEIHPLHLRM